MQEPLFKTREPSELKAQIEFILPPSDPKIVTLVSRNPQNNEVLSSAESWITQEHNIVSPPTIIKHRGAFRNSISIIPDKMQKKWGADSRNHKEIQSKSVNNQQTQSMPYLEKKNKPPPNMMITNFLRKPDAVMQS